MTVFEKNKLMSEDRLVEKRARQFMLNPKELENFKIMVASSGRRNDQLVLNKIRELEAKDRELEAKEIENQNKVKVLTFKLV